MHKELSGRWADEMIDFKGKFKEVFGVSADVRGDCRFGRGSDLCIMTQSGSSVRGIDDYYLEHGLHLVELGPRVLAGKHLHDETAKRPNIRFTSVRDLFDNLRCHPEN